MVAVTVATVFDLTPSMNRAWPCSATMVFRSRSTLSAGGPVTGGTVGVVALVVVAPVVVSVVVGAVPVLL